MKKLFSKLGLFLFNYYRYRILDEKELSTGVICRQYLDKKRNVVRVELVNYKK